MVSVSLSQSSLLAWAISNQIALQSQAEQIEPVHLYLSILSMLDDKYWLDPEELTEYEAAISETKSLQGIIRSIWDLTPENVTKKRRSLERKCIISEFSPRYERLHRSNDTLSLFRSALEKANISEKKCVSVQDLAEELSNMGLDALVNHPIKRSSENIPINPFQEIAVETNRMGEPVRGDRSSTTMEKIGRDLTQLARDKKLAPVVGREQILRKISQILIRTNKRNVLLIGEPGVGKTAVVEGLAQHLICLNPPNDLANLRIVQISVADIMAGSQYRGEMEKRLQSLVNEVVSDPNLILFIDEIHLVIGSGATRDSNLDIANVLKPALARDDFRCIGATTTEEYERHIKKDSAFARRFQIVRVPEPTIDEAVRMCQRWADRIESIQNVRFDPGVVVITVELSSRHILNRNLPDKAIDLLETAAAKVKLDWISAGGIGNEGSKNTVTEGIIKDVLKEHFGIHIPAIEDFSSEKLFEELQQRIIGQDKALHEICDGLFSLHVHSSKRENRPRGIFLFTGPTGVGKSYSAECLAQILFKEQPDTFARFNMNEYKEKYDLSRLIGAAPGLIGHDQAGALFAFTERSQQGILLLDEFDRANPEVQEFFLEIFDRGATRDSRGRPVDMRRYFFILTSNHSLADVGAKAQINQFSEDDHIIRPEILGRIDYVIDFPALSTDNYTRLFDLQINRLKEDLLPINLSFDIDEIAKLNIILFLCGQQDGVRGFTNRFEQNISTPIYKLFRKKQKSLRVKCVFENGIIQVFQDQVA